MSAAADLAAALTMRGAEWIGMRVPRGAGLAGARAFMRMQYRRSESQRQVVAGNLARVLGHPPDSEIVQLATREAFDLYARYWYETFALRSMSSEEVSRRFSVTGVEHIDDALAGGRGVIMALPHMGNWDAAGHWLAISGYRMTAVAEELKPKAVFDLFYRHRRALGMDIVPLTEGGRVAERLVMVLAENRILTLLADRNLSGRGVEVEMFGEARRLPSGPALLALTTGSPLLPACVYTTAEGWHTQIDPPLEIERTNQLRADVTTITEILARRFERSISAAPSDWHMFQPAWDTPPAIATGEAARAEPTEVAAAAP